MRRNIILFFLVAVFVFLAAAVIGAPNTGLYPSPYPRPTARPYVPSTAVEKYIAVAEWGTKAPGGSRINFSNGPMSVSLDNSGNLYATEMLNYNDHTGHVYRINNFTAWPNSTCDIWGTASGAVYDPGHDLSGAIKVDVDPNSKYIYGAFYSAGEVKRFNPALPSATWEVFGYNTTIYDSYFSETKGVAVDSSGNVFVTDLGSASNSVRVTYLNQSGQILSRFLSGAVSGLVAPNCGISPDRTKLYVSDQINKRIIVCGGNGIYSITSLANLSFGAHSPTGVAADSSGNIYAADYENNRVVKMDSLGKLICEIKNLYWSPGYTSPSSLYAPMDVAVDSTGDHLFVADYRNLRIVEFVKTLETAVSPASVSTTTKPGLSSTTTRHRGFGWTTAPGQVKKTTTTTFSTSTTKRKGPILNPRLKK